MKLVKLREVDSPLTLMVFPCSYYLECNHPYLEHNHEH